MSTSTRDSVEEYEELIRKGYLETGDFRRPRFQLVEGEILPMSPIGSWRQGIVDILNE